MIVHVTIFRMVTLAVVASCFIFSDSSVGNAQTAVADAADVAAPTALGED